MLAVARMAAQSSAVRPFIMGGGIVGARVTVRCVDGRPGHADGGGRGALLGALGKVGGDGCRIGGQHLVPLEAGPFGPALPRRAVERYCRREFKARASWSAWSMRA